MTINTPVIFADGSAIYNKLADTYTRHKKGLFILAPSGTGKSYFVNNQSTMDWIDGDVLWVVTNADASGDEWGDNMDLVQEINERSDIITKQAKKQGFWVIGSSNRYLQPDAIVLPPWETHKAYIRKRENQQYDGGAKEEDFAGVKMHRAVIAQWESQGVPRFDSVAEATAFLAK